MTIVQEKNLSDHPQSSTDDLVSKSKLKEIQKLSIDELQTWGQLESKYWNEINNALQQQKNNNNTSRNHSSIVQQVTRYTNEIDALISSIKSNTLF